MYISSLNVPRASTIPPFSYTTLFQSTSLTLHGTGLSISDVDAGSGSLTVTLSVTEGTLRVPGCATGAEASGIGSSAVTITGTQAQINNLLDGNSGATVSYID